MADRKSLGDDVRRIRTEGGATNDNVTAIAKHLGLEPVNPDIEDGGA